MLEIASTHLETNFFLSVFFRLCFFAEDASYMKKYEKTTPHKGTDPLFMIVKLSIQLLK